MAPLAPCPTRTLAEVADALAGELAGDGAMVLRRVVHPAAAEGAEDLALAVEQDAFGALAGSAARTAVVAAGSAPPPAQAR